MDITKILIGAIILLSGLFGYFGVFPYLKSKLTVQQLTILKTIAKTAVFAAEQIIGPKMGADKLAYAIKRIKEALEQKGITFNDDQIRDAIEEQVRELTLQTQAVEQE